MENHWFPKPSVIKPVLATIEKGLFSDVSEGSRRIIAKDSDSVSR
jgi:hypothetical protein